MKHLFKKSAPSCATEKTESTTTMTETLPQSTRRGRKIALVFLVIISIFWCWQKINNPATFPIRAVKIIDANNRVDHRLLQEAISPFLDKGMLWIDNVALQHALAQIPWVAEVTLKRGWPDQLVISITEQQPIAHWNNNELLDNKGMPFDPGAFLPQDNNLPWLNGPENQQKEVWAAYDQMNQMLASLSIKIRAILLTDRQSWEVQLNNGILLYLGRDQVFSRLQRFIAAYPKIFANRTNQLDYVDLRYSNGLAVKWKNNPTHNSATPQK